MAKKQTGKERGLERRPPANLEAEKKLLGCCLVDARALATVVTELVPEHFYKPYHQAIFQAMLDLFVKQQKVDLVTVADQLEKYDGDEPDEGGPYYLSGLPDTVASAAGVASYCMIVKEKALRRDAINACYRAIPNLFDENIATPIDELQQDLFNITARTHTQKVESLAESMPATFDLISAYHRKDTGVTGLATGFKDFDQATTGLHAGEYHILAARPSMGKSALAINMARNIAIYEKKPALIFSLEMSKDMLNMRFLAAETKIDLKKIRAGRVTEKEWPLMAMASERLAQAQVQLDDTARINTLEILAKARNVKAKHDLAIVFIDYIQLVKPISPSGNKVTDLTSISEELKAMAKSLEIPVVVLSQLSRAVEQRQGDKRPILSDLRESGALEQDADGVFFIYRPEMYERELTGQPSELIIAKQRNGPLSSIKLYFHKEFASFSDVDLKHTTDEDKLPF